MRSLYAPFVRNHDRVLVFDGRNLYEPSMVAAFGLEYHCIGRAAATPLT